MTIDLHNYKSCSEQDTEHYAQAIASVLRGGEYLSLEGELGAGKTLFSKAFARALGIESPVTSPTFVIQKTYQTCTHPTIKTLAHYDFYRITDYHELIDLGFEDHDQNTVVLVEWGNLFARDFPIDPIRIKFEILPDNGRLITTAGLS